MIEIQQYVAAILEKLSQNDIPELIQDSFTLGYLESKNQGRIFQFFLNSLEMLKNLRELENIQIYSSNQIKNLYNKVVNQNGNLSLLCAQLEADTFEKQEQGKPKSFIPQSQFNFKFEAVNYDQQNQNYFESQILQQPQNQNSIQRVNSQQFQQPQKVYASNFGFQFQDSNQLQQMVYLESNIRKMDLDQQSQEFAISLQEQFDAEEAKRIAKKMANEENNIKIECQICLEVIPIDEMATLSCTHIYHIKCLNKYCMTQIQARQFPIICPSIGCKKHMKYDDLTEVLDDVGLHEFQTLTFKAYVETHSDEYSWCPTPDCSYIFIAAGFNQLDCPICKKSYCLNCKVDFHNGLNCQQYMDKIKAEKRANNEKILDDQFLGFVKGAKYKQCPSCKFWVEKNQGCDHMTCRCKFQFCYVCGGVYLKCGCVKRRR